MERKRNVSQNVDRCKFGSRFVVLQRNCLGSKLLLRCSWLSTGLQSTRLCGPHLSPSSSLSTAGVRVLTRLAWRKREYRDRWWLPTRVWLRVRFWNWLRTRNSSWRWPNSILVSSAAAHHHCHEMVKQRSPGARNAPWVQVNSRTPNLTMAHFFQACTVAVRAVGPEMRWRRLEVFLPSFRTSKLSVVPQENLN